MTAETAIASDASLPASLTGATDRAAHYATEASSAATRRAYRVDWRDWTAWCDRHGLVPLPASPASVGAYMTVK